MYLNLIFKIIINNSSLFHRQYSKYFRMINNQNEQFPSSPFHTFFKTRPKKNYERQSNRRAANVRKGREQGHLIACSWSVWGGLYFLPVESRTGGVPINPCQLPLESRSNPLSRHCPNSGWPSLLRIRLKVTPITAQTLHPPLLNFETRNKSGLPTFDTLPAAGAHASDGRLRLFIKPAANSCDLQKRSSQRMEK